MICKNFSELSSLEKFMFVGRLTHACMNDNEFFDLACKIINDAETKGLFENVKFMPRPLIEIETIEDDTQN